MINKIWLKIVCSINFYQNYYRHYKGRRYYNIILYTIIIITYKSVQIIYDKMI